MGSNEHCEQPLALQANLKHHNKVLSKSIRMWVKQSEGMTSVWACMDLLDLSLTSLTGQVNINYHVDCAGR